MFNTTVLYLTQNVIDKGRISKLFLLVLIDFIAIAANGFFLFVACYRQPIKNQSRTYIYFSYVSLTNLMTALFVIPFPIIALAYRKWVLGSGLCYFAGFMTSFCLTSCIYSITILSIHKYASVVRPMQRQIGNRRIFSRIGLSFILSFIISIVPFAESQVYFNRYTGICAIYIYGTHKIFYTLFVVFTAYVVPTLVNISLYIRIFHVLRKHSERLRSNSCYNEVSVKSQKKIINTLCIMFTTFIVVWTPFFVYAILYLISSKQASINFLIIAYFFGFLNSVINPLIFIFRNIKLRNNWSSIFGKKVLRKITLIPTVSTNTNYDFTIENNVQVNGSFYSDENFTKSLDTTINNKFSEPIQEIYGGGESKLRMESDITDNVNIPTTTTTTSRKETFL